MESQATLSKDVDESLGETDTLTVKQESQEYSQELARTFVVDPYEKGPGSTPQKSDSKKSKRVKKHIKFEYIQQAAPVQELVQTKQEQLASRSEDEVEPQGLETQTFAAENAHGLHNLSPARELEVIGRLELQNRQLLRRTPDMNVFVTSLLKQVDRKMVGKDITCLEVVDHEDLEEPNAFKKYKSLKIEPEDAKLNRQTRKRRHHRGEDVD